MKYKTKAWLNLAPGMFGRLQGTKQAERFSEKFYRELYKAEEQYQVESEKLAAEEEPDDSWLLTEDEVRKDVRRMQRYKIKRLRNILPTHILDQVADIRVLALNCCTPAVKREITAWCKQSDKKIKQAMQAYEKSFKRMFGDNPPDFWPHLNYHDYVVTSCRKQGTHLVLRLDNCDDVIHTAIFKHCTVITKEQPFRNATWLYEELYAIESGYELHVLLLNSRNKLIDFIIQFSDVSVERTPCDEEDEDEFLGCATAAPTI
ncbi:MAG: DUF4085 domain-containing protein [Oscillospiraceae bacterium]|nr:DUF4085 domain-containing protein [Oscillospiraceae bacterium]